MEQAKLHSRHLIIIQVYIDSFFSKKKEDHQDTELDREAYPWSILHHETLTVGLASCLFQEEQNREPETDDVPNDLHQKRHVSELNEMPSSPCAQRPSFWQLWTPSLKTVPDCQRWLRHTSEVTSWWAPSRKLGARPTFPCTHSQ